jgi:alpha-L-fucosidase 2
VLPLQTDPWGRATPESDGWDVWVGAAAWLAQHLWWRWEWGGDLTFLRERAWPVLQEVAAFYEDYLVPHDGRLHIVPSQSPENTFEGGVIPVSLCISSTSDVQLADEALRMAAETCRLVGGDPATAERWDGLRAQLPPMQIGRHGQLQEWLEDHEENQPEHRHLSHLFALYPGDAITVEATPELAQACRVSLERRLAHHGGHTGWSRAWTAACFARLGDGDAAHEHLVQLVREQFSPTLLDLHPPDIFQIDGTSGSPPRWRSACCSRTAARCGCSRRSRPRGGKGR